VVRRIFGPEREEAKGGWEKCIMRSLNRTNLYMKAFLEKRIIVQLIRNSILHVRMELKESFLY
jgi:hypothetical protein